MTKRNIYTIPATESFAITAANYAQNLAEDKNIPLSKIKIFLPTRRGCRTLQEAFLQLSKGKPRLLPMIESIGDADQDAIQLHGVPQDEIKPAIDPIRRQMMLARLLEKPWPHDYDYQQALHVASDLGQLIDQIHTENIDIQRLPDILDQQELAEHWEITSQFLVMVLGELWPAILEESGVIDPGLHRRLKIEALTKFYQGHPPQFLVIMAGSTGSLPATRQFIKTLLACDNGHIILPALDTVMDERSWFHVEGGHPQFLLKTLINANKIKRQDVKTIGLNHRHERILLASEMMRPAQTTEDWQSFQDPQLSADIQQGAQGVTYCEAETDNHEAMIIALAMLEIAADPDQQKTATFITPDRYLAMRVQANLRQWGIDIDDSGGTTLPNTSLGQYALAILHSYNQNQIHPVALLTALKNTHVGGGVEYKSEKFRSDIRRLEKDIFRGVRPAGNFDDILNNHEQSKDILMHLKNIFKPLSPLQKGHHNLQDFLKAHIQVMENLAGTQAQDGAERLWVGEVGEAMANFFNIINQQNDVVPAMPLADYIHFIDGLMAQHSFTARYGKHPRLSILGQIESRMVQTDRVILGGLNEGIWPADTGFDVWMSRNMRRRFGLPSYDQKTSLSAHDFYCGFCAPDVFVTRSKKSGGQPNLKSRWIDRLETVLQAANIDHNDWPHRRGDVYANWAQQVISGAYDELSNSISKINRPAPCPPVDRRPTEFSVTDIEKWMRDPYWIYAKKILRLKKWDDVDMDVSAADRGTLIHDTLEQFTKSYPGDFIPNDAYDILLDIGKDIFDAQAQSPEVHGFWWPRFTAAAHWFIDHETQWRSGTDKIYSEVTGQLKLTVNDIDYHLKGKADRIEKRHDGAVAVIDYKTGASPAPKFVINGVASQLPLEAYMLQQGAFDKIHLGDQHKYQLFYWQVTGSGDGGKAEIAQGNKQADNTQQYINEAATGLRALIAIFQKPDTPYYASPNPDSAIITYNDYAHLERIAEWSVTDGELAA